MARDRRPTPPPQSEPAAALASEQSPLSLSRLRAAFAQMLGTAEQAVENEGQAAVKRDRDKSAPRPQPSLSGPAPDPCEISPRTVVEAMLFVGRPDSSPFNARELAAAMRGVGPAEIDSAVVELNSAYERDAAPYTIVASAAGYRFELRSDLGRLRDKLRGRARQARLTPAAVEVLSVVAYNQPTTADQISELRGTPSGPALQALVRRNLVRVERLADRREPPHYWTTERFLRIFGLESIAALPRNEELEKL